VSDSEQVGRTLPRVRISLASALGLVVFLGVVGTSWAVATPGRTQTRAGTIEQVALTHASVAFVVGENARECAHVELWDTDEKGTWRFGRPTREPCQEHPSTGSGIAQVAVAHHRVLWVSYAGGNFRDWELWTATATRKTPRRLRFVSREVDAPAPIVVGPGSDLGVPFGVDDQLTLQGDNGSAVFRATTSAPIRAVTAGSGPEAAAVLALLSTGAIEVYSRDGRLLRTISPARGTVEAIALAPVGVVAQVADEVLIYRAASGPTHVRLPAGATMLDYAEGRILYRLHGAIHAFAWRSGSDRLLVQGTPAHPVPAALDTHGFAWGIGKRVAWSCAACLVR
jgi:hypothetical protein